MTKCPFILTNPDMPEAISSYVENNCSELVSGFTELHRKSPQLDLLREQLKSEINALDPDVKQIFEENVYKLSNNSLYIGYTYREVSLNDSWVDAKRINDTIVKRPDDMPNFLELATKIKEVEALINNSGDYQEDLEKLNKIKTTFRLLSTLILTIKLLAHRLAELYEEYKKLAKEEVGYAVTGRNQGPIENLKNTFDDENARERAGQAEAATKESRKAGIQFENVDKAIYQEQCFLLSQLTPLIELKRKNHIPRLPYVSTVSAVKGTTEKTETINRNAPILIYDEPFGFINRLTQTPHSRRLFNLTTDKLSSLVPTIKLYKVQTDPGTGKDVGYVEVKFDTNPAVKSYAGEKSALDLFRNSKKRGVGVGLKDFNFTFHGSDPFAAKKAIQAKLSIFATSFGDLIQDRRGDYTALAQEFSKKAPLANYKFADLALKTGRTPDDLRTKMTAIQKDNLDKLNFRLKVVMGWAIPQNYLPTFTKQEREAVNDSFININLTPTTHEFSFDEMGGVGFDINYLAYIEDYFNNSMFNIFSSKGIEGNRIGRKLFYEFLTNEKCEADEISKAKEVDAGFIQQEKTQSFAKIMMQLSGQKKILYYNLDYKQISTFLQTGKLAGGIPKPTNDSGPNVRKLRDAFKTAISNAGAEGDSIIEGLQASLVSTSRESNKISFFYISDLIDVIMQNIEESLEKLTSDLNGGDKSAFNYYDKISKTDQDFIKIKKEYEKFLDQMTSSEVIDYDDGSSATIIKKTSIMKEVEKLMKAREQFKKLRIILGPMEVKDPFNENKTSFCSIGDIPISLNYFTEFLTEKVLSKEQAYYPITNFIKDITNELIRNFINNDSCFSFNTKQRVRLNSSVITGFNCADKPKLYKDDITYYIDTHSDPTTNKDKMAQYGVGNVFNLSDPKARRIKPVINVSGPSRLPVDLAQPNREINYYVFYAGRAYPVEKMQGNEEQDAKDGIFHYILGKDRGIVKNISLDRTDMTGLKELRFEQEGFDGLTQLREVYNANIDCLLNMHTFPGTYIYVDPRGFSPEMRKDENGNDFTQFGIGGYYMITRSEHSIGPGKADTKITAKWVADTGGGNDVNNNKKPATSDEQDKPKKCTTSRRNTSLNTNNPSNTGSKAVNEINKRTGGTGFIFEAGKA
jgi:hypothetical protein